MSDLLASRKDFKKRVAEQSTFTQRRAHTVSTQLSVYRERQPAGSGGADTNRPSVNLSNDSGVLTRVHQIIDFLKKSQRPCSVDEIRLHVSEFADDGPEFHHLSNNAKVSYNQRENTFAYKPEFNIRTADELIEYLRTIPDGGGLEVKKLSDSYLAEYTKVVADLRKRNLILATTDKKDNRAKYIFYNHMVVPEGADEETKLNWTMMTVPDEPELGREMEKAGLPRTKVELTEVKEQKEVKKTKKSSRQTKLTNTHLADLIDLTKDYVPGSK
ncbi:transcription factor TFIIE beta subunit, TFIIEB, Tfa2 [Coemansia sp. RSA 2607]|nr:transcription factor TFIIE beta subunit, TFIIEB, Tfa2 [Coemansia sp. RSA 2607]KAJ2396410.1 transcription factor TFIIE beta subunit, TFIIEB, Tfa2 [Coemansia sp. RSA 2603]